MLYTIHQIFLFFSHPSCLSSKGASSTFSANIPGLGGPPATSPREGIIDAMANHQKGTLSLGEASHDPQFWNGLQEY